MYPKIIVLGLAAVMLTACGGGGDSTEKSEPVKTEVVSSQLIEALPAATTQLPYHHAPRIAGVDASAHFSATGLPEWATIAPDTGVISGTPDVARAAVSITVSATTGNKRYQADALLKVEHAAVYKGDDVLDFYSKDFDGNSRILRDDLSGGILQGEVQFVQSHSVAPAGNFERNKADETQSKYMPKLVALREALVLFLPEGKVQPTTVHAEVSVHGEPLITLPMAHPNDLPASDITAGQPVEYSTQAWSATLPWDTVRNGLSIRFVADKASDQEQFGDLPAAAIDIGEATQMVLKNLRLGMLTEPGYKDTHWVLIDPVMAATDYFQTAPVSKLIIGSYADMTLDRVIIGDGTIYDKNVGDGHSAVEGGWHSGDMRENVGKSQVSVGINLADFGVSSNNMRQWYNRDFKQITSHHAWGMYTNGRVEHGGSGGNGIGTLTHSSGNEASHEWGHDHSLGHYPGQGLTDDGRWARHHADSGWGYIAFRNRMRRNFNGFNDDGSYNYLADAMSGGSPAGPLSKYTHYTGYSGRNIQNHLAGFPIPDTRYASGYKMWNTTTGEYEDFPSDRHIPEKVGVPVATILGGYDPDGKVGNNAVIYPVFHGNYGNIFDLQAPDPGSSEDQCWVTVSNAANEETQVRLPATRHHNSTINQLHFNLEASFKPTLAVLSCRRGGVTSELTRTEFDGQIPELPPVAVVGQEVGYSQLREREMAEMEKVLVALSGEDFAVLNAELAIKVDSYSDEELKAGLSGDAWQVLERLQHNRQVATRLEVTLNRGKQQNQPAGELADALISTLQSEQWIESGDDLAVQGNVIHGNGRYFDDNLAEGKYIALTPVPSETTDLPRWIMDQQGRIHSESAPWQCITRTGNRIGLATCASGNNNQAWVYQENATLKNKGTNACLDYDRVNDRVITYNCTGNWNQKWSDVTQSKSRLLSNLNGGLLMELYNAILPE